MYSKTHKKNKNSFWHVGNVPNESKKLKALWNRVTNLTSRLNPNNISSITAKIICAPIPPDQDAIAARARGEKLDNYYFNPVLTVKVI